MKLDKYEMLLIRECKSLNPSIRKLRKIIAKRNMLFLEHVEDLHLARVLLDIVSNYDLTNGNMKTFILQNCDPEEQVRYVKDLEIDYSHASNVIRACVYQIRFSKIDKFPNFIPPLRFKIAKRS